MNWMVQLAAAEATVPDILQETVPVAQEVAEDINKLKPNAILETLESWIPGLISLGYRLLVVGIIVLIGMRVIGAAKKVLNRS